jgi:chemotaxis protein MotB
MHSLPPRLRTGFMTAAILGAAIVSVGAGCQNKVRDENMAFHRQNNELQARNRELENQLKGQQDSSAQVQQMQQELADRDAKINDLQNQLRTPAPAPVQEAGAPAPVQQTDSSLAGIEVTRDDRAGTVTVNLPGNVLFQPGSAILKESAKTTLNKIVKAIKKDYPGKQLFVDGYTDPDPISRTKDKWKDNLDLSAARARTVAEYLSGQGLEGSHITPRAMNASNRKKTKDASRRVEIVVQAS